MTIRRILLPGLALAATLALACRGADLAPGSWPPPPVETVAFEAPHDLVLIPVEVARSGPRLFLFDTGSTITQVDTALVAEAGLKQVGRSVLLRRRAQQDAVPLVRVPRLALGERVVLKSVEAAAVDLSRLSRWVGRPVAGILGGDAMQRLRIRLDYPAQLLRVGKTGRRTAEPQGSEPLSFVDRLPVVEACLEGRLAVPLVLDTGAMGALVLGEATWRRLGRSEGETVALEVPGLDGETSAARLARLDAVVVGGQEFRDVLASIQPGSAPGYFAAGEPPGLLGAPLLRRFVVDLDLGRGWAALRLGSQPGTPPAPRLRPCPEVGSESAPSGLDR